MTKAKLIGIQENLTNFIKKKSGNPIALGQQILIINKLKIFKILQRFANRKSLADLLFKLLNVNTHFDNKGTSISQQCPVLFPQ